MLEIKNISFSFGKSEVLKNISFNAESGKCTVLLGVNGEGKTTLLKCICGILRPKTGEALYNGKNILKLSSSGRAHIISYVPQSARFADIDVFNTVLSGRRTCAGHIMTAKDTEKAADAIELLGLSDLADKSAKTLSGGEQRKLAVARALCTDVDIIIMDEPLANLDLGSETSLTKTIRELCQNTGKTFIVTMHDLSLSTRFADKFVMLKDGTVFAEGDEGIISKENIRSVYGINADIIKKNGHTVVVPE